VRPVKILVCTKCEDMDKIGILRRGMDMHFRSNLETQLADQASENKRTGQSTRAGASARVHHTI
jgi:hypothetical protein